jgi:hypothetical protein
MTFKYSPTSVRNNHSVLPKVVHSKFGKRYSRYLYFYLNLALFYTIFYYFKVTRLEIPRKESISNAFHEYLLRLIQINERSILSRNLWKLAIPTVDLAILN